MNIQTTPITFKQLLEKFLFEKEHREDTRKSYIKVMKQLIKFDNDAMPNTLTREQVLIWRKERLLKIKPVTWNNYVRHLHAIFNFGLTHHILTRDDNPMSKMKVHQGRRPKKTYQDREIAQIIHLIEQADNIDETELPKYLKPFWFTSTLINTLRYTAIRRGQLLKLPIDAIDLVNRKITISEEINKTHEYYEVPISQKLYPHLEKLLQEHRKLYSHKHSQLFNINLFSKVTRNKIQDMSDNQLSHFFKKLSEYLRFRLSPHRFRHTTATQLMQNPSNLYVVQKLLGHKNISVTLEYIQYDVDMIRNSVDML